MWRIKTSISEAIILFPRQGMLRESPGIWLLDVCVERRDLGSDGSLGPAYFLMYWVSLQSCTTCCPECFFTPMVSKIRKGM
jgi:hypothetical protein